MQSIRARKSSPEHLHIQSESGQFAHEEKHLGPEQEAGEAGEVVLPPLQGPHLLRVTAVDT